MSTRLTALEWDAVRTALSFMLAGETDEFEPDLVKASETALSKLFEREEHRRLRAGAQLSNAKPRAYDLR